MGNPLFDKQAVPKSQEHSLSGMIRVLVQNSWRLGSVDFTAWSKQGEGEIVIDDTGWAHNDENGKQIDFGSDGNDLSAYLKHAERPTTQPKTEQWVVKRDDKVLTKPMTQNEAFKWLMDHQSQSTDWAIKHEGYSIVPYAGVGEGEAQMSDEDKKWLKGLGIQGRKKKKAVGLTNTGQPDAVCPKCHQPIAEGQMVNYPAGKETHIQCPPSTGQQPGQQMPGWQSRLNLPSGYKPPQRPVASLLQKNADARYIDDEWREILQANGYHPRAERDPKGRGSGYDQEIWRNPYSDLQIAIGHMDVGGDPFWATMSSDGMDVEGTNTDDLLEIIGEALADTSKEPPRDLEQEKKDDTAMLKSMGIIGRQRTTKEKYAGKPPRFSFTVPMEAAGKVAFHLAKAGMEEFEVVNFEQEGVSIFAFTNEPEMHVGEEIIRAEFASQIAAEKGAWQSWSPELEDPSSVKPENELKHEPVMSSEKTAGLSVADRERLEADIARMVVAGTYKNKAQLAKEILDHIQQAMRGEHGFDSGNEQSFYRGEKFRPGPRLVEGSGIIDANKVAGQWGERSYDGDTVHDILDKFRPKGDEGRGFDEPVPAENLPTLLEELDQPPAEGSDDDDHYLGVIVFLATHGSDVPAVYRARAKQIAEALIADSAYLGEWQNPASRKAELEKEIDILGGTSKTGGANADRINRYRRAKLLAWIEELGLDFDDELKKFDTGDFWAKDQVYEEVRDMIKEGRKFQNYYTRKMVGKPKKSAVLPPPPPPPPAYVQQAPAVRRPVAPVGSPTVVPPSGMQDVYLPHVEHPEKVQEKLDQQRLQQEQKDRREGMTGVASKID